MVPSGPLPSFCRPPLSEVVLALQFENLDRLDVRHLGRIAKAFESKFPGFSVLPPIEPAVERFDRHRAAARLSVQVLDAPIFPRIWLTSDGGEELVQIQRDRLMHNWRQTSNRSEYPRYSSVRDAFAWDWSTLEDSVQELGIGQLLPTQCEVSYVNRIPAGTREGGFADPSRIFGFISSSLALHGQANYEAMTFSSTGVSTGVDQAGGVLMGRLITEIGSAVDNEALFYGFTLTLRGAPAQRTKEGVLQFFDFAHERIVRGFAALTTPEMHIQWERER